MSGNALNSCIRFREPRPNRLHWRTHKEGHRIEDVSEDEFQSQLVDTKATTDPGQESIKGVNKGKDRQYICSVGCVSKSYSQDESA
jgi:hypothetical protein